MQVFFCVPFCVRKLEVVVHSSICIYIIDSFLTRIALELSALTGLTQNSR